MSKAIVDVSDAYEIRRARPEDAPALVELGSSTFTETFGHLYAAEDLNEFLRTAYSLESWQQFIADEKSGVWLAARTGHAPDAYVLAGPCALPVPQLEPNAGEIKRLYVRARAQNARLGTRLLQLSLDWLATQGYAPLYVGVWSENFGAQRLYGRFGFEKVGEYGFHVGCHVDHEFILKRP